jgi:hypothetical protein
MKQQNTMKQENTMKQNRIYVVILVAAVIMTIALNAGVVFADSDDYRNYALIKAGMNQATSDFDNAGYDAGIDLAAVYGRYLTNYLVLEGGLDLFYANQDLSGATATAGSYSREDRIDVAAFLVTLKGEFPVGPVRLFAGGGVGGYLFTLNSEIESARLGEFDTDDSDEVFGVHVVTGGRFNIGKRFFFGIEGLYRWTQDVDVKKLSGTVPVEYSGNLNGYTITFSSGYRF